MKFPESWLRAWCNPPLDTQALAHALTMGGMEVESLTPAAPPFSGVVVGEIIEALPHPNADKLRVCQVLAGEATAHGPLQIVCGAPNARVGLRVPLALVGATLPPATAEGAAFEIKAAKLRGVESAGMLCSARELGLSSDHAGLLELDSNATVGQDIRQALGLDDQVFELKLTPNLAHALSVFGVARELSALTGAPLKQPTFTAAKVAHQTTLPVQIDAPDLCGRFTGRVIRGVNPAAKTPAWMVDRLARCGQRSVNALVDISNYVMFELGRPSHIFDLDKIHERLVVRWANAGETLTLLNGSTVTLDASVGVIADNQAAESLAGIMGGDATATSDATKNIYVEAAFWHPLAVQGRSRRFGFNTDAGHRFERGVDPSSTVDHVEHLTALIQSICGGEAGPMDDQKPSVPTLAPVTLRAQRAAKVIGMPITLAQCANVMSRLGFPFVQDDVDGGRVTVTPPPWRFDIQIEEDLIEEVIRVLGFDQLPDVPPVGPIAPSSRPEARRGADVIRRRIAQLGYLETINYSFVKPQSELDLAGNAQPIKVLNPIAAPMAVMRSSLMSSLLDVLSYNVARRATRVRVFEVGRVFQRSPSSLDGPLDVAGVSQPMRVAGLAWGPAAPLQWGVSDRAVDYYDVQGDLASLLAPKRLTMVRDTHPALHPGRCARVIVDGQALGWLGELHPRWRQQMELPSAPILFELDLHALRDRDIPHAQAVPKQQVVRRDMALVVQNHVAHDDLMRVVHQAAGGLLKGVTLFDVYKPKAGGADIAADERGWALRLEWQDDQLALTDERIDAAMAAVLQAVQVQLGARLRAGVSSP